MAKLEYRKGDVTEPHITPCVIPHITNSLGIIGSGVALGIARKWPNVKSRYHEWAASGWTNFTGFDDGKDGQFMLGNNQIIGVAPNIWVCNMIAQKDVVPYKDLPPIRYEALTECLMRLDDWIHHMVDLKYVSRMEVIAPKFGSLRSGGDWDTIEDMVKTYLTVDTVHIYEFQEK